MRLNKKSVQPLNPEIISLAVYTVPSVQGAKTPQGPREIHKPRFICTLTQNNFGKRTAPKRFHQIEKPAVSKMGGQFLPPQNRKVSAEIQAR